MIMRLFLGDAIIPGTFYLGTLLVLIDIIFFLFVMQPTVASFLRVSLAIIKARELLGDADPEAVDHFYEKLLELSGLFFEGDNVEHVLNQEDVVSVEILNIMLALDQVAPSERLKGVVFNNLRVCIRRTSYFGSFRAYSCIVIIQDTMPKDLSFVRLLITC